ncbi:hypothetical protein B0293_41050 [Amycolatopsis azurea DSM 43854]|uniref:Uncharacterized protein n=2 Tax=Amycolatopsis azurea TaxID=36819 RepID=A0ABX3J135_9PSEU|nr:hypothetical protein B0293_41050 [Amycolatopsis azurea DSM 43854]
MKIQCLGSRLLPAMVTITTWEMDRWHASVSVGAVTFGYAADDAAPNTAYHLPRVWPGRGLAIPAAALESFHAALAEVRKQQVCQNSDVCGDDGTELWSVPWPDPDEEFVFITGPCEHGDLTVGYRPAHAFVIALPHLRGLLVRVTGYLCTTLAGAGTGRGSAQGNAPARPERSSVPGSSGNFLSSAPARARGGERACDGGSSVFDIQ